MKCQHLNRGNIRCDEPATHRNWTGRLWMPLCADCARIVYNDTRGKCNPTPLPDTLIREKSVLAIVDESTIPPTIGERHLPAPAPRTAIQEDQLRKLRLLRESLAARPDNGSL